MPLKKRIKTAKKKVKTSEKKKRTSVHSNKSSTKKTGNVSKKPSLKTALRIKKPAKAKKKTSAVRKIAEKRLVSEKKIIDNLESKKSRMGLLKKALLSKRGKIIKEARNEISKYMSGETRQLVDTALDDGDWAVVDISEDISLRMLAAHRKAMHEIDEAIRKIDEGTYGICEECGEEISEKRLSILPAATLCIDCQENKEKLEAIEKEEMV